MITFNVGGKLYTTTFGTLELMVSRTNGDDLLNMLVRQRRSGDNKDPIFIDRDHKLFRWILYEYREGVILKHSDIGVPKSLWDCEIDFYGIKPLPPSPKKSIDPSQQSQNESEQELISYYKTFVNNRRQAKKQKQKKDKEEYNSRKPLYLNLMRFLLFNSPNKESCATFVKTGEGKNGPYIPSSARMINGIEYDPIWLRDALKELNQYASTLGYGLEINVNTDDNTTNYANYPASSYNTQYTRHHKVSATVKLYFKTLSESDLQSSETSE